MYYVQKTGGTGSMLPAAIRLEATSYRTPALNGHCPSRFARTK